MKNNINRPVSRHHCQRGAVLFVTLIILIVMTLIGVTAMRTTTMEEKMAGNMLDRNLALQATETALRDAEQNFIEGLVNITAFNGSGGLYGRNNAEPSDLFVGTSWTSSTSRAYSGSLSHVAVNPRYFVKIVKSVENQNPNKLNVRSYGKRFTGGTAIIFRITARGTGGSDRSQAVLRSHYGKIF